ncbi:sensory box histidine kinase/response regulator [hydrothermal vent metagenome]|uniref:Sensory box histidine kinase/response regulator n=1 Tax=hydrothermal vent metagenome TaxID=652676 RepID=A0A1W1CQY1_9ZZZZ
MDLLIAYQNELLAAVAIFVVIIIYIIVKRKTAVSKPTEKLEVIQKEESLKPIEEKDTQEESEEIPLDGKEEGSFDIEETIPVKQTLEVQTKRIHKRDVPPHDKITKEDFQEFSGERILLAEDNIINQKVIQGLLADSGIEVVIANDGVEVLEILQEDDNFNIILMDAHMPRMDGFEATRKIRANSRYDHIVVVALSGDTASDDIRKMNEAGMTEHLEKPLKMDAFYDILYAYAPLKKEEAVDIAYSEINTEKGLEISGNDSDFYNEILQEFIQSYKDTYKIVDSLIQHNQLANADQLLLDISGVAANIGADKLHNTAVSLKASLKNNDNERSRLLFDFKEHLANLLKEIERYLHVKS